MAVVTGTVGATATPGADLYALIAAELGGNANWTFVHTITAAAAGTTGDVKVWKCTAAGTGTFYVFIEVDDTTPRVRWRAAEVYNENAATPRIQAPVGVGGTTSGTLDSTAVTPTATNTITNSDTTLTSTNPYVAILGFGNLSAGFTYLIKVTNDRLTVGIRISGVNSFVSYGAYDSLVTAMTDSHPICAVHSLNAWGGTGAWGAGGHYPGVMFSRALSYTSAVQGPFFGKVMPMHCQYGDSGTVFTIAAELRHDAGVSTLRLHQKPLISVPIIHGCLSGSMVNQGTAFRGYLSDFLCAVAGSAEPAIGDTVEVDGVTYYWLPFTGVVEAKSNNSYAGGQVFLLAIKAT